MHLSRRVLPVRQSQRKISRSATCKELDIDTLSINALRSFAKKTFEENKQLRVKLGKEKSAIELMLRKISKLKKALEENKKTLK